MSSAEDIREVMADETQRGRRFEPGLSLARFERTEREVSTMPTKIQKFGELLTRIGNAIEGVPEADARAALEFALQHFTVTAPATPRPPKAAPVVERARPEPRPIHASPTGPAAKALLDALRNLGGEATTREIADALGKSTSTVTHTLRAMEGPGHRKVTRVSLGRWRLGPGS